MTNIDISTPRNSAQAIGSPIASFEAAEELLQKLGTKTMLDCPAGQGAFAQRIITKDITVKCCDIRPVEFVAVGLECDTCDLNDSLPYEAEQFDTITCLNGIHRIWARGRAFAEFSRVLKPAGHVIITIPNPTNLMRRLSYMGTGVSLPNTVGPPDAFLPDAKIPAAHVRLPITIPEIDAACRAVGLVLVKVTSVKYCTVSVLLSPLLIGVWALAYLARGRGRIRKSPLTNSLSAIFSERVLILAKKPST
jgi:SAM-dependent methyltransferase